MTSEELGWAWYQIHNNILTEQGTCVVMHSHRGSFQAINRHKTIRLSIYSPDVVGSTGANGRPERLGLVPSESSMCKVHVSH